MKRGQWYLLRRRVVSIEKAYFAGFVQHKGVLQAGNGISTRTWKGKEK